MYMKSWVTVKVLQFDNAENFDCYPRFHIHGRRPPPHPAAGRGVFDFILPVPPIRLFFTTVDMCYLILWNFRDDFLTF